MEEKQMLLSSKTDNTDDCSCEEWSDSSSCSSYYSDSDR